MLLPSGISVILLFITHAVARHASDVRTTLSRRHDKLEKRQSSSGQLAAQFPQRNFTMPIDHFRNESKYAPHSNGTFTQFYWFDDTYYRPGGPVIVNTMGEDGSLDLQWFQNVSSSFPVEHVHCCRGNRGRLGSDDIANVQSECGRDLALSGATTLSCSCSQ